MRTIREGCFETNSSSTHSICIRTDVDLDKIEVVKEIEITLDDYEYEFGWERVIWYSYEEKLAYLILGILSMNYCYTTFVETASRLERLINELKEIGVEKLTLKGLEVHLYHKDPVYFSHGESYVDHASEMGDLINACLRDSNRLKRFLFCTDSYIKGGNDNDDEDVDIHEDYEFEEYYKGN